MILIEEKIFVEVNYFSVRRLFLLLLLGKINIYSLIGRLTRGLNKLFVDSEECRLSLLTPFVQSDHLQGHKNASEVRLGAYYMCICDAL